MLYSPENALTKIQKEAKILDLTLLCIPVNSLGSDVEDDPSLGDPKVVQ